MTQLHVIHSDAFADAIGKLNTQSQVALALTIAEKGKAKQDLLSIEMSNRMNALEQIAQQALQKADILEGFEQGQLEEAFRDFLSTSGITDLLGSMSINLGGTAYTVSSALLSILNADQIVDREANYDSATGNLISRKYTLQDGQIALMEFAVEPVLDATDTPTGDIRFNGVCTNWRNGMPAYEHFVLRPVKTSATIYGDLVEYIQGYTPVLVRNIVLDITSLLVPAASINSGAPDLNADGVIGNTSGTGTGDTGTGDTGTGV